MFEKKIAHSINLFKTQGHRQKAIIRIIGKT